MSVFDVIGRTKFNPYMLLLLLAGVVAVTYVALGATLLREHQKQEDLSSQIDSAEAVLAGADDVRQDMEDLEGRLAEAREELAAAQAAFPSELDSDNILKTVLDLAGESQVRVTSVNASPPEAEATEDTSDGETLTFDLQVEGDFGQLIAFLEALEEGATSATRVSSFVAEEAAGRYVVDLELLAFARSTRSEASAAEDESPTGEETEATSDGEETPGE